MESKPHLRLTENNELEDQSDEEQQNQQKLPSAFEAVANAGDAEDAFWRLQGWSQSDASLSAPAHELEKELFAAGLELLRRLLEENFRSRGLGDVGVALEMERADEVVRLGYRREHDRDYESIFGTIEVRRLGYGKPGEKSIHPLDDELNLPKRRYSYLLQQWGSLLCGRGPYDEALDELSRSTAGHLPRRQLEAVVTDMAEDFESFYEERCSSLPAPEETGSIIVAGVDCKGIPRRKTAEELSQPTAKKLGAGEKRTKKKMATVASVHTTEPFVRSAEDVVKNLIDPTDPDEKKKARPRPEDRRLWASVRKTKDEVFAEIADELERRDPNGEKTVAYVTDGEEVLRTRAEKYLRSRCPNLILVLDIIHVLDYLWKAAYVFNDPGSDEARQWVRERLLRILQGRVVGVVSGMRQMATKRKLTDEERKPVDNACRYYMNNKDRMRYDYFLSLGLPIASGTAEGACGHLVKDRMELTGAIWDINQEGAEAILKIRALDKSGDFEEYCDFHTQKERERLYGQEYRIAS